ncbi:MAG: hypothetical protein DRJ28_05640 [Actinobacteria bacterium]|nr:MAG: hypothetical protein DRJ28_05640 [Actinomycetota bacterium]
MAVAVDTSCDLRLERFEDHRNGCGRGFGPGWSTTLELGTRGRDDSLMEAVVMSCPMIVEDSA